MIFTITVIIHQESGGG